MCDDDQADGVYKIDDDDDVNEDGPDETPHRVNTFVPAVTSLPPPAVIWGQRI